MLAIPWLQILGGLKISVVGRQPRWIRQKGPNGTSSDTDERNDPVQRLPIVAAAFNFNHRVLAG